LDGLDVGRVAINRNVLTAGVNPYVK